MSIYLNNENFIISTRRLLLRDYFEILLSFKKVIFNVNFNVIKVK